MRVSGMDNFPVAPSLKEAVACAMRDFTGIVPTVLWLGLYDRYWNFLLRLFFENCRLKQLLVISFYSAWFPV